MGNQIDVRLNRQGFIQLRNSQRMQAALFRKANAVQSLAGRYGTGAYRADVRPGKTRAHARASTTDIRSIMSNRKHNSLLKALGAVRNG